MMRVGSTTFAAIALLCGCAVAEPEPVRSPAATFGCAGGQTFDVLYLHGEVEVRMPEAIYRLKRQSSAPGQRYASDGVVFIHDDDGAVLEGAPAGPFEGCREYSGKAWH